MFTTKRFHSVFTLRLSVGTSLAVALGIFFLAEVAWADSGYRTRHFGVDVAMIGQTFFDFEEHPDPGRAGIPPSGSPFIIQGWIYRAGTFRKFGNDSGVNADGSAEFPGRVVGKWICRGWHLQDGDALTGVVVATTQIFDFSRSGPGANTLVTDGIELADFDVPFKRAIVGGTGFLKRVRGENVQTYVGFNASDGFNTSFRFRLTTGHFPLSLVGNN